MSGFRAVLAWELRTGLRRVSTWVYFGISFGLAFFPMLAMGGAFDFGMTISGRLLANSPYMLATLMPVIALLMVSATAAISGNALYRDHDAGVEQLLYTTPISRSEFLGGRFAGAIVLNLVVLSGIGIGTMLAAESPFVQAEKIAPFEIAAYIQPYLVFIVPSVVLTAAIFFSLVALTRQMVPVYAGGVVLLVGYLISTALLHDLDNRTLAAMLDPFGTNALSLETHYWSVTEKNTMHVPFEGVLLWNRLAWLGVGFAIFAIAYHRFRFAYDVSDKRGAGASVAPVVAPTAPELFLARVQPADLPRVTQREGVAARLTQLWAIFARSFIRIVRNRYFAVIVGAGLLFLGVGAREAGRLFGTPTWPVTYHMTEILMGTLGAFAIVIVAVYSGELVWAERDVRSQQIVDATPVPTWVMFLGKLGALCAMIAVLLLVMLVAGIVTQALKGYHRYELPLYIQSLFGVYFVDFVLMAAMAMAIHVLVNHKYMGHLVVIMVLLGTGLLPLIGLERGLYLYSYDSGTVYSDMNRWGPYLGPFLWWKAYWLAFMVLLLVATTLIWVRGEERHVVWRLRLARDRVTRPVRMVSAASALAFAGIGGFLYYNTDVLNVYRTGRDNRKLQAERERKYKQYELAPQPRVVAVNARVDLRPREQDFDVTGSYVLRNKTPFPIDTIHLGINEFFTIRSLTFDGGAAHIVKDSLLDYHMFRLTRPLSPGDSVTMRFALSYETRGIPHSVQNTFVVENGTFLSSHLFLPQVGYWDMHELSGENERRKEKLPAKDRMPPPTDPATWRNNYVSRDADWIRFEATVSTDTDQVALAPGYLQREWTENGRRLFHYTMDAPILNFWAVLSGRYSVKRDTWRDVDIAVFYHPTHTYNIDRMIASVKKSLDYFTEQFGPYQHRQVRIVEFPRYAPFAQSLPNLIPYSEALGFIARIEKRDDIDYPFYVTAHELAHAWWAHQVIGADAQGSTMLSETLSQYSALMVMEKEYGARNMRRFLAYELDSYLAGRATEARREMPLQLGENQAYLHYNKGSLVMYALRDYIGEERVNGVLRKFLESTKFKGPPYPTSLQLVEQLRAATPDSLKYMIHDLFETTTIYTLRTDSVVLRDAPDQPGKFAVDLWVYASKSRADTLGKETEVAMRDWIDIGVYADPQRGEPPSQDRNGIPLYLAKQRVDSGAQKFTVVVDRKPIRAGIDPLRKLIDRLTIDNVEGVRDRTARTPRRDTARRRDSAGRDSTER